MDHRHHKELLRAHGVPAAALAWIDVVEDLAAMGMDELAALRLLTQIGRRCYENEASMDDLLSYWIAFEQSRFQQEQEHFASCHEPDCEVGICRNSWGEGGSSNEQ